MVGGGGIDMGTARHTASAVVKDSQPELLTGDRLGKLSR
jgi:hypothetical protein